MKNSEILYDPFLCESPELLYLGLLMENHQYMKWDAFRSTPRSERVHKSDAFYLYWLQWVKFFIFFTSHCSCLCSAFISKVIVLIIATNIGMMPLSNQSFDRLSCLCAALWLIQVFPDVTAFLQDVYRINKRTDQDRSFIMTIVFFESCRAAGLSLLTMTVFPLLDLPRCVLLSAAIGFLPYLQYVIRHVRNSFQRNRSFCYRCGQIVSTIPMAIVFLALFSGNYLWHLFDGVSFSEFNVLLPAAFTLCAIGYWETWIDTGHAGGLFHDAYEVKYGIRKLNAETRMCSCILRFACATTALYWALRYHDIPFGTLIKVIWEYRVWDGPRKVFILSFVAIAANFFLRGCLRFLAAMRIKLLVMFHPTLITLPTMFMWSYGLCHYLPLCRINYLLHTFGLSFYCVKGVNPNGYFTDYYVTWIWLAAFVVWNYYYIAGEPVDPSDELVETMSPMLSGLDVSQSLMIFHWAVNRKTFCDETGENGGREKAGDLRIINGETDRVLTLYVCATMWHETRVEMTQMIKSILLLDEEHALRLSEKNSLDTIKFRLEIHIFFDDAWVDDKECGRIPNAYFKLLFEILMELTQPTGSAKENSDMQTAMLANTSYGGRLVLMLEAGTLLFVHLKDKKLIRHKKRWSQVMYMYYLLGHRIMDSHLGVEDRQLQAENTYILAIDGDSKFEPNAVIKLLHLMNIKSDVGCACGRIHPIGEGIMVWYQKFEYAIAHWFQKAAEHVFGCVLCAPGCFSLFRASALMDDNVMQKYTKTASEPRHFVQYDQGEDRWLSTLLLKQGYRIEYAAAADAETYAPEGFEEFFNQRRRWTPSSIANTLDLLADYQLASKNNRSISWLYILYQMFYIGFSLLGPAIIFTMLVYAQVSAFAVDSTRVLIWNGVPICLFIVSCFYFESSTQLAFAKIASIVYAFIMMAVLIATTQQIVLETVFSPTSTFVLTMFLIFLFSSLVHPKEFSNIIFGCVFFLMIPSTYVFLSLYSLINLNVINWGTREAVAKATGRAPKKSVADRLLGWIFGCNTDDESLTLSRLMAMRYYGKDPNGSCGTTAAVEERLRLLEQRVDGQLAAEDRERPFSVVVGDDGGMDGGRQNAFDVHGGYGEEQVREAADDNMSVAVTNTMEYAYRRALWMDCEYLQSCDRGRLRLAEERFWDELIDKYLKPIESTQEEESNVAKGLVELRNRISFSIILVNALLVLAVFLLQRHKDVLSIQLTPYEGFKWIKMNETTGRFEETTEALKVDPLGMGIIFFLMGILIVQTVGMIIHRLNTLVEALHELNEMKEQMFNNNVNFHSYKTVLDEARQMIDTVFYEQAHGADGYVRSGLGESKSQNNVLYKLHSRED